MPLVKDVKYIKEPTPLQCGQAVLAMLSGKSVDEVIKFTATDRETNLKQMFLFLENVNIKYSAERVAVNTTDELPNICILSLETPRCWHWSLYFKGIFYDPEHGIMDDFPKSYRKYYFKIEE